MNQSSEENLPPIATPASQPVLVRIVRLSVALTVALVLVGGLLGFLLQGQPGMWGAIVGAAIGGVCMLLSPASIAFANRFVASPYFVQIFFGSVLGTLLLKLVFFLVAAFLLRGQPWLHDKSMFIAIIVGVSASLAIDLATILRMRMPTMSDLQR